jgi:hypothetical protein
MIARECKSETELFCRGMRPSGQRIIACLKVKIAELSPACLAALISGIGWSDVGPDVRLLLLS